MKNILIVLAIIFTLIVWEQKETHIKLLNAQDTILALGDSLTFGHNALPTESYPSVLAQLSGHHVINAGVNGNTSYDGLKRLPSLLRDPLIQMIRMAKEKNIKVLLVDIPNITLFGLSPLELYEEIAQSENVALNSGILADILSQPSLKSDQIHPNAQGYKQMAEKIYGSLKDYNLL